MIKQGLENLINWLDLNGIDSWQISRSRNKQDNNFIFKSSDDAEKGNEIKRMEQVLSVSENGTLYIFGQKQSARNAQFSEVWSNAAEQPTNQAVGTTSIYDENYIEKKIAAAVQATNLDWERKQLERELKEFKEAKKEYEREKSGIVGMLVDKISPVISGVLNSKLAHGTAVAGIDKTTANPIKPITEKITENETEKEELFSPEEGEKITELISRWKLKDKNFMPVLEKIVAFSEKEDPIKYMGMAFDYEKVKEMLLNFNLD